jgi:hypothetical protein
MSRRSVLSRSLVLFAVLSLALLCTAPLRAQRLEDGESELLKVSRPYRALWRDLFKGVATADPKDDTHQKAAEFSAKEAIYPLYWKTVGPVPPDPKQINNLTHGFEINLLSMTKFKASTLQFQQMYCRQAIERCKEVIQRGKPIAGINAARMLSSIVERPFERGVLQTEKAWSDDVMPRLAEGNAEYLAATAVELLTSPKANDAVKYYLYKTLAGVLGMPRQTPPLVKKETEEKAITLALKQVETPKPFPRAALRGEVEGYKVLRREAVRAVAAARLPVSGDKDHPALALAKLAGNDTAITPPPRIDERLEAAIGLARMGVNAAKFPDFQPDYVAQQIAFGVLDFASAANNDIESSKTAVRQRGWRAEASRLIEALDSLKAEVKTPYVQTIVTEMQNVLRPIEGGGLGPANVLGDWLSRPENAPQAKGVFKSMADSAVKRAAGE